MVKTPEHSSHWYSMSSPSSCFRRTSLGSTAVALWSMSTCLDVWSLSWDLHAPGNRSQYQDLRNVKEILHHGLLPLTRTGESQEGTLAETSEVEGILSCFRAPRPWDHPGPGLTFARARSCRDLSRRSSRCEGADQHPAAKRRTPSTQAKAACRLMGRGRSVVRKTRVGDGANDRPRSLGTSKTNSGILHRCLSWGLPMCL